MNIVKSPAEMTALARSWRQDGATIGFVPTMGALHAGHVSLLEAAHIRADKSVMSIFVNPAQFGPAEDLARYPRSFEADCAKAEAAGCAAVFAPEAPAMYPSGYRTFVKVEELGDLLCGRTRPNHFRGVATIVLKLFNIVTPHIAFFGGKDAQQVVVLKRMVCDLDVPVIIEVRPTVREADGLRHEFPQRLPHAGRAQRSSCHLQRHSCGAGLIRCRRTKRRTA